MLSARRFFLFRFDRGPVAEGFVDGDGGRQKSTAGLFLAEIHERFIGS